MRRAMVNRSPSADSRDAAFAVRRSPLAMVNRSPSADSSGPAFGDQHVPSHVPPQHLKHEDDADFQWVNVNENAYGTFIYIGMVQVR